jgi:CRP/FNR family transcriptional regulator, dissimilatory nitrate respiration regulator
MNPEIFRKVYIFSSLADDELEKLKEISRLKKYNKGENIFFDTEPYVGFYFVTKGLIKIYKISRDGREHILHIVGPYNTFAEVPLFENLGEIHPEGFRYPANCMALEDGTEVILVPARSFNEMIEVNRKMCLKMISGFAKRLRYLNHHIEDITLKDVAKRVAGFVLSEFNSRNVKDPQRSSSISLSISKNDLAALLGTIPETLSRTFKKLSEESILEVDGKKIEIIDLKKLEEASI